MRNKILHFSFLSLSALSLLIIFSSLLFAEESIAITTYYPSPYGSYNELGTNKLAVGYTLSTDMPNRDGDIRLKPQPGDPATAWPAGQIGQFAYSSANDALYHFNGAWVAQAGGGPGTWACAIANGPAGVTSQASCPIGKTIISGGCGIVFGAQGSLVQNRPTIDGWFCSFPVGMGWTVSAYALCCS